MKPPKNLAEAEALLERYRVYLHVEALFLEALAAGRDGRPIPDDVKFRDYWTGEEADRMFADACQAEGVPEDDVRAMNAMCAESPEHVAIALRQAGHLTGLTWAGMRKLEKTLPRA